jgi:hypothetical protein
VPDSKGRKRQAMAKVALVQQVLREWDPIPGSPGDEYDSYAPHIVTMVASGCTVADLAWHLRKLRTQSMGVSPDDDADGCAAREILGALAI